MDIAIGEGFQRTLGTLYRGKNNLVFVHELRTTHADLQGVDVSGTSDGDILASYGHLYASHLQRIVRRGHILVTAAGSKEGRHGQEQYLISFHHIVIFTL